MYLHNNFTKTPMNLKHTVNLQLLFLVFLQIIVLEEDKFELLNVCSMRSTKSFTKASLSMRKRVPQEEHFQKVILT